MAERLHDRPDKPFTLYLSQEGLSKDKFDPDQDYWLRITSLDGDLSQLLLEMALSPDGPEPLRLLDAEFEVVRAYHRPEEHPWAGVSSFEELYNNWVAQAKEGRLPEPVGLRFYSPTGFRRSESGLSVPLPWPKLVFQSLLEKWNRFSPVPLELDLATVEHHVGVARHRLETKMLDFGEYKQVGFVGECWFLVDRQVEARLRNRLLWVINLLADFAFYAGVGRKTTMGMGQARRIEAERR